MSKPTKCLDEFKWIEVLIKFLGKDTAKFFKNEIYAMKNVAGRILADLKNEYKYCNVCVGSRQYSYRCDGYEINAKDIVAYPLGEKNEPYCGQVKKVTKYKKNEVPYPLDKTKSIYYLISNKGNLN